MLKYCLAVLLFFGNQLSYSLARSGGSMSMQLCENNKTVSVQILTGLDNDMSCKCIAGPSHHPLIREDYVYTPGIGSHKLHTNAKTWNEARKVCNEEGGHLAIINSHAEESLLVNMLVKARKAIRLGESDEVAYLGAHDLFSEGEWVTVFGESIYSTGYSSWSKNFNGLGRPDNGADIQNCAVLTLKGGMDDVYCPSSFAFFCEIPTHC